MCAFKTLKVTYRFELPAGSRVREMARYESNVLDKDNNATHTLYQPEQAKKP